MLKLLILTQIDANNATSAWKVAVQNFGVPGAIFLVALFAFHKGWIFWGRERAEMTRVHEREVELLVESHAEKTRLLEERYEELRKEATERLGAMRTEKDMWRDAALKGMNIATKAVEQKDAAATGGQP